MSANYNGPNKIVSEFEHRICVNGSRSYSHYEEFASTMDRTLRYLTHAAKTIAEPDDLCIITGAASRGPDEMVIRYCCERKIPWFEYPADWDAYGKRAGFIRNCEMRDACTHLISFWDRISNGTAHMIDECLKHSDTIHIVMVFVQADEGYYERKAEKAKKKALKKAYKTAH